MRNLSQDESCICAVLCSIVSGLLLFLVAPIRHCDTDAAAEFCHYLAACMCVLFVRVHHDVTVV